MTRRQSNNQWSSGIAAHPAQKNPSAKIRWKSSRLDIYYYYYYYYYLLQLGCYPVAVVTLHVYKT